MRDLREVAVAFDPDGDIRSQDEAKAYGEQLLAQRRGRAARRKDVDVDAVEPDATEKGGR